MLNWKPPTSVTEIRSFLGLAGYYCKFVEGFSKIAAPLTRYRRRSPRVHEVNPGRDPSLQWTVLIQGYAFEEG